MSKPKKIEQLTQVVAATKPHMVEEAIASTYNTRRNAASTIERTDRYKNIDEGLVPFKNGVSVYGSDKSSVDVRDAVILCQKCYYNFAIFRNIIDLMTEFSVNNIFYRGGSKKSRDFFEAWQNKINIWDFQDKFFREYYRSGNIFIYKYESEILPEDVSRITQVFGAESEIQPKLNVEPLLIPARYVILNPADVQMTSTANFGSGTYYKILSDFELLSLRNPKTEEDVETFNALPTEVQTAIKRGDKAVMIPLDPKKISMVFYKKQDYEPFAVPMGYPVLEDINFKTEMKKIDMAISRTMQQIILLVTNGTEPDKGGINQKNIDALKQLFTNQSVGRVLIADYTTKAEWKIPEIGNLLDPKKYEVLDRDINIGLNNIFVASEKFANQAQKVELFVARLEQGRKAFLNNFLIPEIKRIAKSVGFKNYPTPYFEDIELKDTSNQAKIYARLMELGILTPEEGLKAIESNTLPDPSLMEEDQQKWKAQRDKGLYEPLVGGAKEGEGAGRPGGTSAPRKVAPIGGKASEDLFSIAGVKDNLIKSQQLEETVAKALRTKHGVRKLSRAQKTIASEIANVIIANEEPDKWMDSVASYIENPVDTNLERVNKVLSIAAEHQIDNYLASILLASKKSDEPSL
jgi:hypothetical protein